MKICVAQTKPIKGDIQSNIASHKKLIELAIATGADVVIFPELSLTGYEPALAKELATTQDDGRFDDFQKIADSEQIIIGIGMPTQDNGDIHISMIVFQPHQARQTYSKKYLHADEEAFFAGGEGANGFIGTADKMALAICYELSVPEHAENAYKNGAEIYVASVAKSASGVAQAVKRLANIANQYSMTVFMSNCVGLSEGFDSAGQTSVWNNQGSLLGQLDDASEGLIIFDTETQAVITSIVE